VFTGLVWVFVRSVRGEHMMNGILVRTLRVAVAVAVAGTAVMAFSRPASAAPTDPPTDPVGLRVFGVNGSGCNTDTVMVEPAPDNTFFELTFTNYVASVGPGAKPTDFRKNCQVGLWIYPPQGYRAAIAEVEYQGHARVAAGATGMLRANFYHSGGSSPIMVTHPFNGPYSDAWQATDVVDSAWYVWTFCGMGRTVVLNTELRMKAGTSDPSAASSISMHTADGSARTRYHFAWARCQ